MDLLAPVRQFDRFQRRYKPLAVPVAVLRNFSDQGAGNWSALIAYWAFFSIFPLLLLFATILGFVLHGDPVAQRSILHSAASQFPIIGKDLSNLGGSGTGLGIGIFAILWSGLGVTVAAQNAFNRVYTVPHYRQPDFFTSRWRGLKFLAVTGVLQVISTAASGLVSGGFGAVWLTVAGIAFSLVLNVLLFFVVFRFFTSNAIPTRELWPGILIAAAGWEVLQAVGGVYVGHVVRGASQTYGTFATVIGLLAWLYLGARVVVYAAEINVTLTRGLWPRSIMDPPEPADRKARAALAKVEERDDKQTVEVAFHPPDPRKRPRIENPPYAVATSPATGEQAPPMAKQLAAPDLHTLTVAEVLKAIEDSLDRVQASGRAKERAREWLRELQGELKADGSPSEADESGATAALAQAARRALGLAGG